MPRRTDYRSIAPVFNRRYQQHDYTGVEQALLNFLNAANYLDVLDAGCGAGHWLMKMASPDRRLIGLDASEEMLGQVPRNAGSELVHASAEALPFQANSFDRVFCVNALHHFLNKRAFIDEARRVLRHGGILTISMDPHAG
jgi:ubiquinone/menaquinone biosynthesis C-methylase UbiE